MYLQHHNSCVSASAVVKIGRTKQIYMMIE